MEKLKSVVPSSLKRMIFESTPEDLPSTCSLLLDFFLPLQLFHDVVRELTDPEMSLCRKNTDVALDLKRKGNNCFSTGDYDKALSFYSQALRFAPINDDDDADKNLVATLYVNRASSLHKMGFLVECVRDCDRAVVLSPGYAKAWYRRGKANAALENYEDAIRDLNVAVSMELSLGGKSQIRDELEIISKRCLRTGSSLYKCIENNLGSFVEPHQLKLQCVSTPDKGRGMTSISDVPQASMIHSEQPYAAIVLKHCRETHCHFCLNELPADTIPCSSCSIPLYCSQRCKVQAGGQRSGKSTNNNPILENTSTDIERHIRSITLTSNSGFSVIDSNLEWIPEHGHECGGVHWPAVLPSEIILAGRVLVKSIEQREHSRGTWKPIEVLELSHNYTQLPLESKLELIIYSIVLTNCLQQSYGAKFPLTGPSASQLVIVISQVKVNSMAVVHMKSQDAYGPLEQSGTFLPSEDALTNSIEQVRVGQAIYSTGSLFNHSCQPNVHAYFLSRTLFIQSTEFVAARDPLELSYGPQVGQWDLKERQQLLEDQYSFKCQCSGCSELNLSDLVLNAFSCLKPSCSGVVLDSCIVKHKKQEGCCLVDVLTMCSLERPLPVDKQKREDIKKVAHLLFEQKDGTHLVDPGYCLNCGFYRDLKSSRESSKKAGNCIRRVQLDVDGKIFRVCNKRSDGGWVQQDLKACRLKLQDAIVSREVSTDILYDALEALDLMRSTSHAYNKDIAQAEDSLAKAFCLVGDFQLAVRHCRSSIEILEKLYHPKHIVIGHELVKLASIQLSLGDWTSAADSVNRCSAIFSLYYGSHEVRIFPYLDRLKREACKVSLQEG